jgi:tRNA(Ile)-lysidine synthase
MRPPGSTGSNAAPSPADRPAVERALAPFVARLAAPDDIEGPIVVGCSGGADSLALLVLLWAAGHDVHAVYVEHGLRAGAQDAATVDAAAARLGVPFHARHVEVGSGGNLEARARVARYDALESVRVSLEAETIAVGHTRDDQAETVLLNLLRGSATSGLAGIPERRDRVLRPILGMRRSDTREICARLRLAPVHDSMNDDMRYRRVWLRRELIPQLERNAHRDVVEIIARQAELLRDEDAYLDALACELGGAASSLDARVLARAPLPLARRVVRQWLGSPPPPLEHVESVLAVARGDRRAAELPGRRRVERAGHLLNLVASHVEVPPATPLALPGTASFGRFGFEAWIERAPPVAWPDGRGAAVLDADRVGDVVMLQAPEPGDRFRPLGRSGTKSVLGALREAGIASSDRPERPIVTRPTRNVCWVVGYRIDEHVKVTARTRRFLWISAEAIPS